jgi:hypothetical protein
MHTGLNHDSLRQKASLTGECKIAYSVLMVVMTRMVVIGVNVFLWDLIRRIQSRLYVYERRPLSQIRRHPVFHFVPCWSHLFCVSFRSLAGRDSSVGIATRYGLDGPGIEYHWGQDYPRPSRPNLGPTQSPVKWVPCVFFEGKAAGAWRWPPPPSSA